MVQRVMSEISELHGDECREANFRSGSVAPMAFATFHAINRLLCSDALFFWGGAREVLGADYRESGCLVTPDLR